MAATVNIKRENSQSRVSNWPAPSHNNPLVFLPGRHDNKIRIAPRSVLERMLRAQAPSTARLKLRIRYDSERLVVQGNNGNGDLALIRRTHATTIIGGGRPAELKKASYTKLVLKASKPRKRYGYIRMRRMI